MLVRMKSELLVQEDEGLVFVLLFLALLGDVLADGLLVDRAGGGDEVADLPEVLAPELLAEKWYLTPFIPFTPFIFTPFTPMGCAHVAAA